MLFFPEDFLRARKNGRDTNYACTSPINCSDRNRSKNRIGMLTMFLKVALRLILVFVIASVSGAYSQSDDLRLTCKFVKPDNPVEKEGFIWRKDVITVEYKFANVSDENLLIADPDRYSPFVFTFTDSGGNTLEFVAGRITTYVGFFFDHAFLEIKKGSSYTFTTNIVNDTKTTRTKDRMGLAEFEGIEYPFKIGEVYRVHSRYRSEFGGKVEVGNTPFRIWNGEVSCDNVLEFRYE